ncbi:hypothetical protein NDR87_14280 [Nocardia sp. CDC159]|uniref:Uncharacterized protein n=1 Tax=Nocardia pulmonis TaxID=2951408 RepID=A0A9X2E749_9NOCA|nr:MULTISPECIES: hypothetical protein [Nocardia]MCM6774408.1 hypothetical protein [Nocardia pulmonis]MCM6787526.1 hypothetical protein [Nocardia sp. CDC159]
MEGNKSNTRSPLEAVHPTARRGEIAYAERRPQAMVGLCRTHPGWQIHDVSGSGKTGHCAIVQLAGWPFRIEVRVIEDDGEPPRVVDLRIYSPPGFGDIAITNADLKAIPLARLAAAAGSGFLTALREVENIPCRLAAPEQHTVVPMSPQKTPRRYGRPRKLTDEFLRQVAEYGREARRLGRPVLQHIAFSIEPDPKRQAQPETVRSWLVQARKKGILDPGELASNRRRPSAKPQACREDRSLAV